MALNKSIRPSRVTFGDNGANGKKNVVSVTFLSGDLGKPSNGTVAELSAAAALGTGATSRMIGPDPRVPRNVTVTLTGTAGSVAATPITVTGKNSEGKVITDTITPTAATLGTYAGTKAFAKVTSIDFPAQTATGVTASVGTGNIFGIGFKNVTAAAVRLYKKTISGTESLVTPGATAVSASAIESNTVTLDVTPNSQNQYRVYAISYNWHLNPVNGQPVYPQ
jgi:hypothetical protein